jgi:signal transduction histidine kinase/ActR/RegA family two-component response regulator
MDMLSRLERGEAIDHFDTVRRRKDGCLVDVSLSISPIRDENNLVVGASKIARDMTERRKEEAALRRSEEQLRQAQKMEAIGSLAGGIAHDFNNILSVILSYASLVMDELQLDDAVRSDLDQISKAAGRAADLTRQLLAFSRQQMLQPRVLDPNQIVAGIEEMLGRTVGEDVLLSVLPAEAVGKIYADAGQIEQVVMNLIVNARHAMPRGGSLTIETSNVVLDAEDAAERHGVVAGRYVMLAVSDTGVGMDPATMDRIFEPFFTTKEEGEGTGLGLSTVHGIVQQSGGHVRVYSEPGKGTTFEVYLPRTDGELDRETSRPCAARSYRGTETVLLVEDEDHLRVVVGSILRKQGYHVLDAQNGGEAFLIAEQFGAMIHLLLTDVVMPRMSGRELAERLAPTRPEMSVLYVSGYTKDATVHRGILDANTSFLAKPLTPEALLKKVRETLDAGEQRSRGAEGLDGAWVSDAYLAAIEEVGVSGGTGNAL